MKLKDKVAVITGGGSGIGEATAVLFAAEGAKVAVCDVNEDGAKKVAAKIKESGGTAQAYKLDITKKSMVEDVFKKVAESFGRLDILINNAGINQDAMAHKMTEEQWDTVLNVNLKGTFLCAQAAMNYMKIQNYGRIVNTSSIGVLGNMGQANYSASKMGVIGLTRTLALEFARYNITVNCVAPGATQTPMLAKMPQDIAEKFKAQIPFKRFADPKEIAYAHLFFASTEASYITGQVLFVTGGLDIGI